MDRLNQYRTLIKQVLTQHAEYVPSHGQIETVPVFDEQHDHYLHLPRQQPPRVPGRRQVARVSCPTRRTTHIGC